jgi:hypothetical protein
VRQLIPDSRVFDAEKVGETLMDVHPGLPQTDNLQQWLPWRSLVVETARRILDFRPHSGDADDRADRALLAANQ